MSSAEVIYRCHTEEEAQALCNQLRRSYPNLAIRYTSPNYDIYVMQGLTYLTDYLKQREIIKEELSSYLVTSADQSQLLAA